jgi:iron complex transport system ATP-binding protein
MSIRAEHLTVRVGANTLLEGATLELRPGELLAVIGPNGAGKSTLLKALAGDITPTVGRVFLMKRELRHYKPLELARYRAVLPQDNALEFDFTALEVALLGRTPFVGHVETAQDWRVAREALQQVNAVHLEHRAYPTLSGGERQRVQLARVLTQIWGDESSANQSRFLLLDEPTSNLDLAHQHETLAIAKGLTRHGIGVLAVLHDLNLASVYADRIAVLHQARMVTCGAPLAVLEPELIERVFGVTADVQHQDGFAVIHARPFEPRAWRPA